MPSKFKGITKEGSKLSMSTFAVNKKENKMYTEQKSHLREILIGLFVTVIGGILVVHYQEKIHQTEPISAHATNDSIILPETSQKNPRISDNSNQLPAEKKNTPNIPSIKTKSNLIEKNERKAEEDVFQNNKTNDNTVTSVEPIKLEKLNEMPYPVQEEELSGIRVSITRCEFKGKKLVCSMLYENISSEPSKYVFICPKGEKMIDEYGITYECYLHSVGNVESQSGSYSYEIVQGTKVKAKMEFMVGDAKFSKLASLEVRTADTGGRHKFYDVKVL